MGPECFVLILMTTEIFKGLLTLALISDYTHVSGIYKQISVMQLRRAAAKTRVSSRYVRDEYKDGRKFSVAAEDIPLFHG